MRPLAFNPKSVARVDAGSAFDIDLFTYSILMIPIRESLNQKGCVWPRETTI
jgi:hypothetical protein